MVISRQSVGTHKTKILGHLCTWDIDISLERILAEGEPFGQEIVDSRIQTQFWSELETLSPLYQTRNPASELIQVAKNACPCRTRYNAGRVQPFQDPVTTKGAFGHSPFPVFSANLPPWRCPGIEITPAVIEISYPIRASRYACFAANAFLLVNADESVSILIGCIGRTNSDTCGVFTMHT